MLQGSMHPWSAFDASKSSCIFLISGDDVFKKFYLESGIHRVQRVPDTEHNGRRHTSTLAIAVLPYEAADEKNYRREDFKIEATTGQGPGGQHRNRNLTAIKITHIPTGLTAYSDTKSQHRNKQNAMAVLVARLREQDQSQKHEEVNAERGEQIRDMGRGTRVRTYNFIRSKVTDERRKKKFRTKDIMDGKLELIYKAAKR